MSPSVSARSLLRVTLLALPALTFLGGVLYWMSARQAGPVRAARLYGAPWVRGTEPALPNRTAALRTQQLSSAGDVTAPLLGAAALEVNGEVLAGRKANASGVISWGALALPVGARVRLLHQDSSEVLLEGVVKSPPSVNVPQRGGALAGATKPDNVVWKVHLRRGVLAVPFAATLRVEVAADKSLPLMVELSGARFISGGQRLAVPLVNGVTEIAFIPQGHHVEVTLKAVVAGRSASFWSQLPVVPGALRAAWIPGALEVVSAIDRGRAYVDLWAADGPLGAYDVELIDGRRGTLSQAEVVEGHSHEDIEGIARWAVVSSEFDLQSMALVGWPLGAADDAGQAPRTWDVRSVLLLDGVAAAKARRASVARGVRRRLFGACALLSVLEGLGVLLLLRWPSSAGHPTLQQDAAVLSRVSGIRFGTQVALSALAALGALALLWALLGG